MSDENLFGQAVTRRFAGRPSRRAFIGTGVTAAAAVGGGLLLAACGENGPSPSPIPDDVASWVKLMASLEILAIESLTTAQAMSDLPQAVTQALEAAKSHHGEHRDAWNRVLTAASRPVQEKSDSVLGSSIAPALSKAKKFTDAGRLLIQVEQAICETYVSLVTKTNDSPVRSLALSIATVEAQHLAAFNFMVGVYPITDSFMATNGARPLSDVK